MRRSITNQISCYPNHLTKYISRLGGHQVNDDEWLQEWSIVLEWLLVKPGTAEHRSTGTRNTRTPEQ